MPFESTGSNDQLTRITNLQTSTIIEMLSGLQILSRRWRKSEWKDRATTALGKGFMESLKRFYEHYQMGAAFIELSIDYPDHHDVPGFIKRVRTLDHRSLAFYLLGRVYPLESLPRDITRSSIDGFLEQQSSDICNDCITVPTYWADDIEEMRTEITRLWSEYWENFFAGDVESCREYWDSGNRELEEILLRSGGTALYQKFFSTADLPPQLPEDIPYTEIRYVPVYHPFGTNIKYFGYGNITILYDCKRNTAYEQSKKDAGAEALEISRALGDRRRLKILKLISEQEFGLNGKSIAARMDLSASVVSRHLSQLKKAGLITEKSEDNRNITYSLDWKRVDDLSRLLMLYLGTE